MKSVFFALALLLSNIALAGHHQANEMSPNVAVAKA